VQKLLNGIAWNFQGRSTTGQWTKDWILVAILFTDPDHGTGKTCFGRGMHCPSPSRSFCDCKQWRSQGGGAAAPTKGLMRNFCALYFLHRRHYCKLRHRRRYVNVNVPAYCEHNLTNLWESRCLRDGVGVAKTNACFGTVVLWLAHCIKYVCSSVQPLQNCDTDTVN